MTSRNEFDFEYADAGASLTYPQQCSNLRENGYVILKGKPCKIVSKSTSQPGKHGHSKIHLVGLDVFSGKKVEDCCPSSHNMEVPIIKREEFMVTGVDESFLMMRDAAYELRQDLKFEPELCLVDNHSLKDDPNSAKTLSTMITGAFNNDKDVTAQVWSAMGEDHVMAIKFVSP